MTEGNGAVAPAQTLAVWNGYDPAVIAEARRLVESTTLSQTAIGVQLGVPQTTISSWRKLGGWLRPPGAPLPPAAAVAALMAAGADPRARRAKRMVDRLYRVFSHEVSALEERLGASEDGLEKDARALASLAKTLETLMALDRDDGAKPKDPDGVDPDDIRARLARRLYAMGRGGE